MQVHKFGAYRIGSSRELTDAQHAALVRLIEQPMQRSEGPLGGRGGVAAGEIAGLGRVVVKRYLRGGILRHFIARWYLRFGRVRPEVEYRLLE